MGAFGRIDVVVNNAGIGVPVPHHDLDAITQEFFEKMLGINLVGPWLVTRACANELRRSSGCIVNISSIAGSTVGGSSIPDRKSTRLNSSHVSISYAVFCLIKKQERMIL